MAKTDEIIQNVYSSVCKMSTLITELTDSVTALIEENKKSSSDRAKLEQIAAILSPPAAASEPVKSKTSKILKSASNGADGRKRQTIESYRKELESLTALKNPTKQEKNRIAYIKWALSKKSASTDVKSEPADNKTESVEEKKEEPLYRVMVETKPGYFELHSYNLTLKAAEDLMAELKLEGKRSIMKPMIIK